MDHQLFLVAKRQLVEVEPLTGWLLEATDDSLSGGKLTCVLWSETLHNATKFPARLPFCHSQFVGRGIVFLLYGLYNVYARASFAAINTIFARVGEISVEVTSCGVEKGISSPFSE